jgi:hypothetical protein
MKKLILMVSLVFFCSLISAEGGKIIDAESGTNKSETTKVTDTTAATDEELLQALATDMDKYGLPEGIYQYDPLLLQLKTGIQNTETASTLYMTFGGIFIVGGVVLAFAAPDLVWAPYGAETNIPYGYFMAGLGGGFIIYDLLAVNPSISNQKKNLKKEFNDTYGEYLKD